MARDSAATERLRSLILKLTSMSAAGELHWERQLGSAHRYARWNNHLLILGPSAPVDDNATPRYLFITPFNSPACIEITSNDDDLGALVMDLVRAVESSTSDEPPTDPFAVSEDFLSRLTD
jgi:hypothetical protein